MNMHAGCECNVVIATCPQRDLESTFLRCDNVALTTLPQPKHNVVTTLSQRDFVCWVGNLPQNNNQNLHFICQQDALTTCCLYAHSRSIAMSSGVSWGGVHYNSVSIHLTVHDKATN